MGFFHSENMLKRGQKYLTGGILAIFSEKCVKRVDRSPDFGYTDPCKKTETEFFHG
jgi:hypothetical protein